MKKILCTLLGALTISATFSSSAFANSIVSYENDFTSEINFIVAEYTRMYPLYSAELSNRVENFALQESFKDYYDENPEEAITALRDSLDYYILYREKNPDNNISPLASDTSSSYSKYYVNCPTAKSEIMQINGTYCGPASVYITIAGIKNHVPSAIATSQVNSQTAHAQAMGTSSNGTDEGQMRSRLTAMLKNRKYLMDYKANFTRTEFINYVIDSLNNDNPVVLLITNPFLSYYPSSYLNNSAYSSSNHYVVVSEVTYAANNSYFTIVDPNNYNNGQLCGSHSISATNAFNNSIALLWGKNL